MIAIANRIKEYWNETKKTLSTLDESDIELLGAFVQGLKMEDLNQLNETVIPMVIELLGKFDGLPEDKLKERAEFVNEKRAFFGKWSKNDEHVAKF